MKSGVNRVKRIKGTASTRTFGATTADYTPFSLDAFGTFPDQNADGAPEDCTIYTQNELCQDSDKIHYNRQFLKDKVVLKSGNPNGPYDINDSLEATVVYGVQEEGKDEKDAYSHRRGRDFRLEKNPGMDWYDTAISIMRSTGCSISVAGPWFPEFESLITNGILPSTFPLIWPNEVPGHNHKIYGLDENRNLIGKSWQGTEYGDGGKHYWTRNAFNQYMSMAGTGAFILYSYDGSVVDIEYGLLYTLKFLLSLYLRQIFS